MSDDDLDLFHVGQYRGMTTGCRRFIACDRAADRAPLPGGLVHDTGR
jgi:hypothetical protein